jgi:hypothetical protein
MREKESELKPSHTDAGVVRMCESEHGIARNKEDGEY